MLSVRQELRPEMIRLAELVVECCCADNWATERRYTRQAAAFADYSCCEENRSIAIPTAASPATGISEDMDIAAVV
jgi:hypothetical protein